MRPAVPPIVGAILLYVQSSTATRACYAPDGTLADPRYLPCIAFDGVDSMCCRLNDTTPDVCQLNGLCYWPAKNTYYRNYCTDKNWNSPHCLPKTTCDTSAGGNSSKGAKLTLCPGGSGDTFCCGDSNSCCTEDQKFALQPTLVNFYENATATATITTTATASPTNSTKSSSDTIAIGAGVGVSLGVLAIAMLVAGFWWGRRHARAKYSASQGLGQPRTGFREADSSPLNELDTTTHPKGLVELPSSNNAKP